MGKIYYNVDIIKQDGDNFGFNIDCNLVNDATGKGKIQSYTFPKTFVISIKNIVDKLI